MMEVAIKTLLTALFPVHLKQTTLYCYTASTQQRAPVVLTIALNTAFIT